MSNVTAFPERDATADVIAANVRAEIARTGLSDAQFAAQFGIRARPSLTIPTQSGRRAA